MRPRITDASDQHPFLCQESRPETRAAGRGAARLLACLLAMSAGFAGAAGAAAQSPNDSGLTQRAAPEANAPAQAPSGPRGPRLGVELTWGRPFFGGDVARIWDRIGSVGIIQGIGVRLGYDFGRLGITLTGELSEFDPGDQTGGGLGFAALLHWRPRLSIGGRFGSRITAGYVRQAYGGIDFEPGQFPTEVVRASGPDPAGNVSALGDGVRLGFGLEPLGTRSLLRVVADASVDAVTFREAGLEGSAYSLRDPGWSFHPRLSVALELRPFSR
mgnify:CR=1 FL=1